MLVSSIDAAHSYDYIYLAPHLDDAVLSCGGQIAQQVDGGAAVLVVTLCAGRPASDAPLSPFAEYLHHAWALGDDPITRRRQEDAQALALLGCDGLHLDQLDAPYRVAAYGQRDAVFGVVAADDPLIPAAHAVLNQLPAQQPAARFYVPLGVGRHVDHQIVCGAGLALHDRAADVIWYEDAPYAATWPNAVEQRLRALPDRFRPQVIDIGLALPRKLRAITAYGSQLGELFRNAPMEQVMTDYAATIIGTPGRFAERVWQRIAADAALNSSTDPTVDLEN
jgi:LmbE family N-acetylglucosaminyl deacetylase